MVMIDDLQKLFLYQRLNLGYECHICRRKFIDRFEHLQHISICKIEHLKCQQCGKVFGHPKILQLHMQFHKLNQPSSSEINDVESNRNVNIASSGCIGANRKNQRNIHGNIEPYNEGGQRQECNAVQFKNDGGRGVTIAVNSFNEPNLVEKLPENQSSHRRVRRVRQAKKPIGLTKIKMEDCLRCDECSCIYIDDKDYYKHMKNFHQVDINNMPIPQQKTKRKCRSCCKQCRGGNCSSAKRPRATSLASNLIFRINMRDNIKDRWSRMVSQQMGSCAVPHNSPNVGENAVEMKLDPDTVLIKTEPDLTHLLSQVEVEIKTEPEDYCD